MSTDRIRPYGRVLFVNDRSYMWHKISMNEICGKQDEKIKKKYKEVDCIYLHYLKQKWYMWYITDNVVRCYVVTKSSVKEVKGVVYDK